MMNTVNVIIFIMVHIDLTWESYCGCKRTRDCYQQMIDELLERDETPCIENASISTTTITIFLRALSEYCDDIINIRTEYLTYEGRNLFEVSIHPKQPDRTRRTSKPVILIDAGQQGGTGPVYLALFVIEQLVACEEYEDMIESAHWVILPCINPDGYEYNYYHRTWYKNFRPTDNNVTVGIDISRNFNESWNICPNTGNVFSQNYKGESPATEIETLFMLDVFKKYSNDLMAYLSLRRDGHSILYPYASVNGTSDTELTMKKAGDIAAKVNYRGGIVQWFVNDSIYNMNGNPVCGHSVDYVFTNLRVPYSYEMRVFLETNQNVLEKYQRLPPGYNVSLRNGYFNGIKELYNMVVKKNKGNNIF